MSRVSVMAIWLLTALPAIAADQAPRFRPAHWVDVEHFEPTIQHFSFADLTFPSRDEGWIVGEKYALHIRGDQLEVAFLSLGEWLQTVSFSSAANGWAGGASPFASSPMLGYSRGTWRPEHVAGIDWPYWGVTRLMAGSHGDAWAIVQFSQKDPAKQMVNRMGQAMLRFDGNRWFPDDTLLAGRPGVTLGDGCQAPTGTWWFVGSDVLVPSGRGMVLARWDGRGLEQVVGAGTALERSSLWDVRCLRDGTVWVVGQVQTERNLPREILLGRYAGQWQRVTLPSDLAAGLHATSLAAVSEADVWVSASCGGLDALCRERFFHLANDSWEVVELPLLPGGRSSMYHMISSEFVSPEEGWAIANDLAPGAGRGLIFHYRDGKWRNRNWNWHFWDAPWFGLFGH